MKAAALALALPLLPAARRPGRPAAGAPPPAAGHAASVFSPQRDQLPGAESDEALYLRVGVRTSTGSISWQLPERGVDMGRIGLASSAAAAAASAGPDVDVWQT